MKRAIIGLSLAVSLFLPAGVALAAPGGPRYTCSNAANGSSYDGLKTGEAKQLERAGYTCVRTA